VPHARARARSPRRTGPGRAVAVARRGEACRSSIVLELYTVCRSACPWSWMRLAAAGNGLRRR
jgi:hypothetical protein